MQKTENKNFWEEQGRKHGQSLAAVNFDPLQEEMMISYLQKIIPADKIVADVGCGNGLTLITLAQSRPNGQFVGYDYAETLVTAAEEHRSKLGLNNLRFEVFDATLPNPPRGSENNFDIVVAKRLLINIKGPAKRQSLQNVAKMLRPRGQYVMIECFVEPLERTNDARDVLGLSRIQVKEFNEYLTEAFMNDVESLFDIEEKADVASLYYYISRVFNAALTEGTPDYHAPMNKIAAKLIDSGLRPMSGFAPEVAYLLRKRA